MSVQALLKPRSVALVGANEKMTFGGHAARNLMGCKDTVRSYFVNPNRDTVLGEPCYHDLSELPEVVDCVVIAVPKAGVNDILEQAGSMGTKAAVVYASGYTEEHSEEGRELDAQLRAIAARYGMSVMGPNCMGMLNSVDGINLMGLGFADEFRDRDHKVAIVSHSGSLSGALTRRGNFPVAYQLSIGNATVTAMEDYVEFFAEDDSVKVIALYMEGLKKPEVFLRALKKAALNRKPIVMLKTGRSAVAAASAASHTGNLAGSYKSYEAVFKKYGVMAVNTLEELVDTSYMMAVLDGNYPRTTGIAGFNLAGGVNILMAEAADQAGLTFPKFTEEEKARLRQFIPGFSTPANPLDATTDLFYKQQNITEIMKVLQSSEEIGLIVTGQDMGLNKSPTTEVFNHGVINARVEGGVTKPIVFGGVVEQDRNLEYRTELERVGIPVMSSLAPTMNSIRYLMDFVRYDPAQHDLRAPEIGPIEHAAALTERESKVELRSVGIPVPRELLVSAPGELDRVEGLTFPLAAKISSPDILHKSDVGGVKLNVGSREEAAAAFDEIMVSCRAKCPEAELEGVLFQEMAPAGTEIILGVSNDPQLGPMVMVGLGGVFVEVFKDVCLCPAPVSRWEAQEMLRSLKSYKLLTGYRGQAEKDVDALADAIVKVGEYAFTHSRELKEMDLNPVFLYDKGKGLCAVDALVVKE